MSAHLYDMLRQRVERCPDAVAIGGQHGLIWKTLTSRELLGVADVLAADLAALGVGPGDRVVYWVPNHWRTPAYYFATWKLGAIVVPFDREMNPEAGAQILKRIEPRLVVAGYGERPAWAQQADLTEWWEPGSRGHLPADAPSATPSEPLAVIIFTSGTTGLPKGVMLTHRNLIAQAEALRDRIGLTASDRLAGILPLSHAFELGTLIYALWAGAATHYAPSRRGPDILRVLQEQHISHMSVVPQILTLMGHALVEQLQASMPTAAYQAMMAAGDRLPFAMRRSLFWPVHRRLGGSLRLMISGGAALPTETHALWERLGVRVLEAFGATECSPGIALGALDGSTPFGSAGLPLPGVDVRLSPAGELLVRGPSVMAGYWRDPDRTADVLRDGWYATGDRGTIDDRGDIRIVGRARELIVLPSGMNVWPQDIEDVLRAHPSVKDAAVLSVPTGRGGATLHAYLIPTTAADRTTNVGQIVAVCNARLAPHQRVATASWWHEQDFPRTAMLKIRRHLLPVPDTARVTEVASVLASDDPVGQAICGIVRVGVVQPRQTLTELGLDSLSLVDLAITLEEKTGKEIHEDALRAEMTVDDVRAALAAAPSLTTATEHLRADRRGMSIAPPLWPYTWGRPLRALGAPWDALLRYAGTRIEVLGAEHLAGLPDRVILAGTHRSFADMHLVRYGLAQAGCWRLRRSLITANMASPMFTRSFAWYGVVAFGLHPIDQRSGRDASLRLLVRASEASGGSVLIFPQGSHTTREAEIAEVPAARFKAGVAHLAAALNVPVVPFGLTGTEALIPPSPEGFKGVVAGGIPITLHRGPLAIAFGAPLTLGANESVQAFTARLQHASYVLTRQAEASIGVGGGPADSQAQAEAQEQQPERTNPAEGTETVLPGVPVRDGEVVSSGV